MKIRGYRPGDREEVRRLTKDIVFELSKKRLRDVVPLKDLVASLVVEDEELVVGVAYLQKCGEETGRFQRFYIRESYRGKGIGGKLVFNFENAAKNRGMKKIFLTVSPKNEKGVRFFSKCGYEKVKEENGINFMEKVL